MVDVYDRAMEDSNFDTDESMSSATAPAHDLKMFLTDEERRQAILIKQAVESCEYLKPLPDLEYAHLALTCHCKLEGILDVAYKLQCFRELYKLQDTVQDGISTFRSLTELQPGFILDVSYLPSEECYTGICDLAANKPEKVQTDADWRAFQGGFYYLMRATATNIQAIRNGTSCLTECEGMGYENVDIQFQERLAHEFWSYYPCNYKEFVWLHTPPAANMIFAVTKMLIKKELRDSLIMGGTLDGYDGRIDTLYTMPSPEAAKEAMLARMEIYLTERYRNEKTFSLTPSN